MARGGVAGRAAFSIGTTGALLLGLLAGQPGTAGAVSPDIVVSQVYGGGGNSGAPFTNDFVELFNRGDAAVDLDGWSTQYASATGMGTFVATPIAGLLEPGQYYLVQMAGGANGIPLPTPDASGTTAMSATAGKVIVADVAAGLTCNGSPGRPCNAEQLGHIVDLVGYGNANFFEGPAAAPTLSNTTAGARDGGGCVDTDNSGADISAQAPTPRNTTSPTNPCGSDAAPAVAAASPANGATNVGVGTDITVTFTEAVTVTGDWFSIGCATSGIHPATVAGGPVRFILDPTTDFVASEACTVTIAGTAVADHDLEDPPDTMPGDASIGFTTAAPPPPSFAIHDIQGASHTSPRAGTAVTTLPGIVTAELSNGFYLQDPVPDGDDATSEAIFVFTGSAPSVAIGDEATVSGNVVEFRAGEATSDNLTLTEIGSPSITFLSIGNPLPQTTVIGIGGRTPPTTVIDDDGFATFDPASDGIDFYESLEAMRVQVNHPVATGPTSDFGEISVLADNGVNAGQRTSRGGVVVTPGDFNPERVFLDDTMIGQTPDVNVGDGFTTPAVGVMDYSFGNYKLYLTSPLERVDRQLTREVTPEPGQDELTVATFNVENLNPNDPPSKFAGLANVIVNHLRSPDIIGLEEIQDNNGPTNDAVTDANETLDGLVAAVAAAGGPVYEYRQINPVDDQDGGQPGGSIRVGFLFRTDRGVDFVDRGAGDSTTPVAVETGPTGPQLSISPGRVDPTNTAWANSRKPLAAEFTLRGETFFVVVNHFNSKGGDEPLFGRRQPPPRPTEVQRAQQAAVLNGFVDSILDLDPEANVIALGDFNDFEFSDALEILLGDDLTALIDTLPPEEQCTYVFEGNSQTLDHVLVSDAALGHKSGFDVVHVNAEFFEQTSDHDPSVASFRVNPFDALCELTRDFSNDPAVANVLCAVLDAAERVQSPTLRVAILTVYRLAVALETGNRPRHAFTPTEGATLQRLSRSL